VIEPLLVRRRIERDQRGAASRRTRGISNSASNSMLLANLTTIGPWSIALIASPTIAITGADVIVE